MAKQSQPSLLQFKPWLTLTEAAKRLSTICSDEVFEADILNLAMHNHLQLSIYLVNQKLAVVANTNRDEHYDEEEMAKFRLAVEEMLAGNRSGIQTLDDSENKDTLSPDVVIQGVWDLDMTYDNLMEIERHFHDLAQLPEKHSGWLNLEGITLKNEDNLSFRLVRYNPNTSVANRYNPSATLPDDSYFVIRTHNLMAFEQALQNSSSDQSGKSAQKTHGNTESNAKKREEILGAALAVLAKWPEDCQAGNGKIQATKIRDLIENKGYLFWLEDGEPPLKTSEIEKLIRGWLKKTGE